MKLKNNKMIVTLLIGMTAVGAIIAQTVIAPRATPVPPCLPDQAIPKGAPGNGKGTHMPNPPEYYINGNKIIIIKGVIAKELRGWMVIESHNASEFNTNGFDPCYTHIVCDYKPMFRKLPTGAWEILFTSEIAENLP